MTTATMQADNGSAAGESNLAPGVAPSFGEVPAAPFEASPERIVLSLTEHDHLAPGNLPGTWRAEFSGEPFGSGTLLVQDAERGAVHVSADMVGDRGPAVRLDATVRRSWLDRTIEGDKTAQATARVVRELLELAGLPGQSTVRVSVAAD